MGRVGENLKKLMATRRVSAKEISQTTGIPASTISQWLSGSTQEPKPEALLKLARFFSVSVEFLITGEHPEVEAIKNVFSNFETQFVTVHQGTYKVVIQKEVDVPASKPK